MNYRFIVLLTCLFAVVTGRAYQTGREPSKPVTKSARFEAVSVKPCPKTYNGGITASPGRLRLDCFTVEELIRQTAFTGKTVALPHEVAALVKGGPSWVRSTRFTIEGITADAATTGDTRALLIQGLLQQRFKLAAHENTQALPVYDLVQTQAGAKLETTTDGSCYQMGPGKALPQASHGKAPPPVCGGFRRSPAGGIEVSGITMSVFCLSLSQSLDRDVIDKTGLTGTYTFYLDMPFEELSFFRSRAISSQSDGGIPEASESGSIFSAVRKLGLRLAPGKNPARLLIVDHLEMPDAN